MGEKLRAGGTGFGMFYFYNSVNERSMLWIHLWIIVTVCKFENEFKNNRFGGWSNDTSGGRLPWIR